MLVITAGAGRAAAQLTQVGLPFPRVEIGVNLTAVDVDQPHTGIGPRLTINFDDRTGVEFVADLSRPHVVNPAAGAENLEEIDADLFLVRLKRRAYDYGRGQMYATAGIGVGRVTRRFLPIPDLTSRHTYGAFSAGVGADWRVASPLNVFVEGELLITNTPGIRTAVGAMLSFDGYPRYTPLKSTKMPADAPPPWPPLRRGMRARVMMYDEREYAGRLSDVTANHLDLGDARKKPMTIARDDVLRVRTPDSIRDGAIRGTLYGALGGAATGVLIAIFGCAFEDCVNAGIAGMLTVGLGMGIGATIGVMADSFHEELVEVYQRPGTASTPPRTAATRKAAIGSVIRW
jgi:hypothetical protein